MFDQDWCRDLFLAFCSWLTERCQAGDITRRVDNYARFFEILDKTIAQPDQLSQSQLAALFNLEELRRSFMVVQFLIERTGMNWCKNTARDIARARQVQSRLSACSSESWGALVTDYHRHLAGKLSQAGTRLGYGTIGAYLDAAITLLSLEGTSFPHDLDPAAVRRFARSHPGYATSITPFAAYLRSVKAVDIDSIPTKLPRARQVEQKLIAEIRVLFARLDVTDNQREAQALIARSISRLYQFPLSDVLALQWDKVITSDDRIDLTVGTESIELAPALVTPALKWLIRGYATSPVFPGRIPQLSMSSSSVRYHVRKLFSSGGHDHTLAYARN